MGNEIYSNSEEQVINDRIKKGNRFNLVLFILSIVWIYYNCLFIYGNRFISDSSCFSAKALLYVIPLPGNMDSGSWLLLALWLFIGLILIAFQGQKTKILLFYPSLLLGMWFSYSLFATDAQCKAIKSCGAEMSISVNKILSKAYVNFDSVICRDLVFFQDACKEAYTFQTDQECASIAKNLILYRDTGIDIRLCQKELRDCRNEFYDFFYGFLSNDYKVAYEECLQKFPANQTGQVQCYLYLNEWKKTGIKPLPASAR